MDWIFLRGAVGGRCAAVCGFVVAGVLAAPGTAAAVSDFQWTGATQLAAQGSTDWSTTTNWLGGVAPSGSVGTLSFPALTSGACQGAASDSCYSSDNDINGISANAISIDDGVPYHIFGTGITLANGITAAPSANDPGQGGPSLGVPITLGASQTWSVAGGAMHQQIYVSGAVTGTTFTLGVNFSSAALLGLTADDEVGAVTVSGDGQILLGNPFSVGSLNATDGRQVIFHNGAGLFASSLGSQIGAVSMTGGSLQIGQGLASAPTNDGTLAVAGPLSLSSSAQTLATFYIDQNGTTPGSDFSQLTATGAVDLGTDAKLTLSGSPPHSFSCPSLTQGQVYPIISSAISLTGTFSNAPDGTVLKMTCFGGGTAPSLRINYTPTSVTATVVPGSSGGGSGPTRTALGVSTRTPAPGQPEGLTAVVTPQQGGSGAPTGHVAFFDNGHPIPTCSSQPLAAGSTSSRARCVVRYRATGSHTLTAHYLGDSNFVASTSAPRTIDVIAAPNTTITSAHPNSTKRTASFSFSGSGGLGTLHFQCRLDAGAWVSCVSPKNYTALARGQHTFSVRSIDSRGAADPSPATHTFTI